MLSIPSVSLEGKRLLVISRKLFIPNDDAVATSTWSELKKHGLSALYMLLHSEDGDQWRVKQLGEIGIVDGYSTDGLVSVSGNRSLTEATYDVVKWLETQNIQINCCTSDMPDLVILKCQVAHRLGFLSDSVTSVKTATSKYLTQVAILNSDSASKHGIKSFTVSNGDELEDALHHVVFPVILKTELDTDPDYTKLLNNTEDCHRHLTVVKREATDIGIEPPKIVVMEYVKGTKYAADIALCRGELLGGVIAQRGPAPLPHFYATTLSVPGTLADDKQQQLIQAAFDCCKAVGLYNGVYDVDLLWDEEGDPKLLEINPRPGGHAINDLAKVVYGVDMRLLNAILACGVPVSKADCNYFTPTCHGACYLPYIQHTEDALTRSVDRMEALKDTMGITLVNTGAYTLVEYVRTRATSTSVPVGAICAFDDHSLDVATSRIKRFLIETTFFETEDDANIVF